MSLLYSMRKLVFEIQFMLLKEQLKKFFENEKCNRQKLKIRWTLKKQKNSASQKNLNDNEEMENIVNFLLNVHDIMSNV